MSFVGFRVNNSLLWCIELTGALTQTITTRRLSVLPSPVTRSKITIFPTRRYLGLRGRKWRGAGQNFLTYLLTYSMMQSPWEANWFAASQEIPRILWNPKVHYRTHKCPQNVPILGQPNPVHIPISHLLEIHPNITNLSTPRSPQWSLSLRFPHQDPIRPPPFLTHTRNMPRSSHSSRFYHPHNIGWGIQIT